MTKKGSQTPQKLVVTKPASPDEPKDVPKGCLLEPQPTQSVEQTGECSLGLD